MTSFYANPATLCESTAQTKRDFSILNSLLEYKTFIFDAGNTEPVATIGKIPKNRHYHNNRNSDHKTDVKLKFFFLELKCNRLTRYSHFGPKITIISATVTRIIKVILFYAPRNIISALYD